MVSRRSCSLRTSNGNNIDGASSYVGVEKEWEEVRCPICIEHPHNAILLLCSSADKGCRPFICDTSLRHSNCFKQFKKSSSQKARGRDPLVCPLCRGQISGWKIIHPARRFMDSKPRSCSLESCDFIGHYAELKNHASIKHPSSRPSAADPTRQSNWNSMQQQELRDALENHSNEWYVFPPYFSESSDSDVMIEITSERERNHMIGGMSSNVLSLAPPTTILSDNSSDGSVEDNAPISTRTRSRRTARIATAASSSIGSRLRSGTGNTYRVSDAMYSLRERRSRVYERRELFYSRSSISSRRGRGRVIHDRDYVEFLTQLTTEYIERRRSELVAFLGVAVSGMNE